METNNITSITVFHHYFDKGDILSSLGQVQAMTDENSGLGGHIGEVVEHGGALVGVHLGDDDDGVHLGDDDDDGVYLGGIDDDDLDDDDDGVHVGCASDDHLDDDDGVENGGTIFQY